MAKKHKHSFRCTSHSRDIAYFSCGCGAKKERSTTDKEKKAILKDDPFHPPKSHNLFTDWHDFCEKFLDKLDFKFKGMEMIHKVEKWLEKHPKCKKANVDDCCATGSLLLFIPCYSKHEFYDVHVVFIPQNGEQPSRFSLKDLDAHLSILKTFSKIENTRLSEKHKNIVNKRQNRIFDLLTRNGC